MHVAVILLFLAWDLGCCHRCSREKIYSCIKFGLLPIKFIETTTTTIIKIITRPNVKYLIVNKCLTAIIGKEIQTGAQTKRGPHQYR